MNREKIKISTEWIGLDALLKFANVASSGGQAKIMILEEEIRVNGQICTQRGKKIYPGDIVQIGQDIILDIV